MGNPPSTTTYTDVTGASFATITMDGKKNVVPASLARYDFKKCDSCRKRKKGCDGKNPCQQCSARGKPDECTREIPRQKLEDALAADEAKNATTEVDMENEKSNNDGKSRDENNQGTNEMQQQIDIDAESAANLATDNQSDVDSIVQNSDHYDDDPDAPILNIDDDPHTINRAMYERQSSSSISSLTSLPSSSDTEDNDDTTAAAADDDKMRADDGQKEGKKPPVDIRTRTQQAAYDANKARESAEKAQAEEYERQPKFVFSMPATLERWDHKKCDRCRDRNKTCNGETPCDKCVRDNVMDYRPCTTHESEQKYKELVAEAVGKQWDKFEDNREIADIRAREKGKKAAATKLKLEIQLSKAQDNWRAAKGEKLKNKIALNKAFKEAEKIQKMQKEKNGDAEDMDDGENDDTWDSDNKAMVDKAIQMSLPQSQAGGEAEDDDVEMSDGESARADSGYQTQTTPDLGVEDDDVMDDVEEEEL